MKHTYTKKETLHIITATAKVYAKMLEGLNYLFIYRNRSDNKIEYFETVFLPRNYQHLTGVDFLDKEGNLQRNSVFFYQKCLDNMLTEAEIRFKEDGRTPLKLEALPKLVQFLRFSKMTVVYNGMRPKLTVDRIVGTVTYCLGFIKDGNYYVPSSCLLEDVRRMGDNPSQILAIFSKKAVREERIYKEIRFVAKGVPLDKLTLTDDLNFLISLEKYNKK